MRKIESIYRDESWIRERYIQDKLTIKEIAAIANVCHRTMLNWMVTFGIPRRTQTEAIKGKYVGEKAFFYGKRHSKETKSKISLNHADVNGHNNPMFGKTGSLAPNFRKQTSDATREKLSKANRGRKRPDVAGSKNHWWKGGKTSLMAIIRSSINCIEWRNSVYERDKYTCQDCGDARGGNLNAHHLHPLALLLDKHNIKTLNEAINCTELWNVSNGITLCRSCHSKKHDRLIRRVS